MAAANTDRFAPDYSHSLARQQRDIQEFIAGMKRAQGTITFSGQPADTQIITIGDGLGNSDVFEFDSNSTVTSGNVQVVIGSNAEGTLDNLVAAINAQAVSIAVGTDPLAITATKASSTVVNLRNDRAGTAGNVAITETAANVVVVGMTGGVDAGELDAVATRVESNPILLTQAVATPGTGEAFAATQQVVYFMIEARRANGVNVGDVYIGTTAVDKDSSQQIVLHPGDTYKFEAPVGRSTDLDAWFVDADTATDGIIGFYLA